MITIILIIRHGDYISISIDKTKTKTDFIYSIILIERQAKITVFFLFVFFAAF